MIMICQNCFESFTTSSITTGYVCRCGSREFILKIGGSSVTGTSPRR